MSLPESPPPPPDFEPVTAWHPMLVALLEAYLQSGYELCPEFLLTRLPQRIDIVIIEKTGEPAGKPRWKATRSSSIIPSTSRWSSFAGIAENLP